MNEEIKGGGPAFPSLHYSDKDEVGDEREYASFEGMTLRDFFAAKAMQGFISAYGEIGKDARMNPANCAKWAYQQAEAMLAARNEVK